MVLESVKEARDVRTQRSTISKVERDFAITKGIDFTHLETKDSKDSEESNKTETTVVTILSGNEVIEQFIVEDDEIFHQKDELEIYSDNGVFLLVFDDNSETIEISFQIDKSYLDDNLSVKFQSKDKQTIYDVVD